MNDLLEKHVMVAVDGSLQARQAVKYAVALAEWVRPLTLTLYHVQPPVSQYLVDEARRNARASAELDALLKRHATAAQDLLTGLSDSAVTNGFPPERIHTETAVRLTDIDRVILSAAVDRKLDALVMGQRGISGIQKTFIDSVSDRVLSQPAGLPVWLVKGTAGTPGRILLAVDGSEDALRAVDHVAFMVSGHPGVRLTFYHVRPRFRDACPIIDDTPPGEHLKAAARRGARQCLDRFLQQAIERLAAEGISEDRVTVVTEDKKIDIAKAIAATAAAGDFGTVVVGRRGINHTFFSGSVSEALLNRIDDRALWVV